MAARSPFTGGVGASKDYLLTVLFWKFPMKFSEGEHHLPAPSCAAPPVYFVCQLMRDGELLCYWYHSLQRTLTGEPLENGNHHKYLISHRGNSLQYRGLVTGGGQLRRLHKG